MAVPISAPFKGEGISALICEGETYSSGIAVPLTRTWTPPAEVGKTPFMGVVDPGTDGPRPSPNIEMISPGVIGPVKRCPGCGVLNTKCARSEGISRCDGRNGQSVPQNGRLRSDRLRCLAPQNQDGNVLSMAGWYHQRLIRPRSLLPRDRGGPGSLLPVSHTIIGTVKGNCRSPRLLKLEPPKKVAHTVTPVGIQLHSESLIAPEVVWYAPGVAGKSALVVKPAT